jgi:hypothetical protein
VDQTGLFNFNHTLGRRTEFLLFNTKKKLLGSGNICGKALKFLLTQKRLGIILRIIL